MQKLFVAASMLFACATQAWAQDAYANVYADDIVAAPGSEAVLTVSVENTNDAVAGFSCDVYLPDGFTIVKVGRGSRLMTKVDDEYVTNFQWGMQEDGSCRILAYGGVALSGTDGDVAKITVNIPEDTPLGEYTVQYKEVEASIGATITSTYTTTSSKIIVSDVSPYDAGYSVTIAPFEYNDDVEVSFTLDNEAALTNVAFDVVIPSEWIDAELYYIDPALAKTKFTTSDDLVGNTIHVNIDRRSSNTIAAGEGTEVATLGLVFDGDAVAEGIYGIEVKNIALTDADGNEHSAAPTASYIKVGAPSGETVELSGHISADVNAALANETSIETLDMSKVMSMEGTFTLVEGRNFIAPVKNVPVEEAHYTRNTTSQWGTIMLPFEVTSDASIQYYQLKSVSATTMLFEAITTVDAGTPAVFKLLSGSGAEVVAQNVEIAAGSTKWNGTLEGQNWTMKGTYTTMTLNPASSEFMSSDVYYISADQFWYGNEAFDVKAYRGWFETQKSPSSARSFTISDDLTGIEYVEREDGLVEVVFNVMGQKQDAALSGQINIINGKKIVK